MSPWQSPLEQRFAKSLKLHRSENAGTWASAEFRSSHAAAGPVTVTLRQRARFALAGMIMLGLWAVSLMPLWQDGGGSNLIIAAATTFTLCPLGIVALLGGLQGNEAGMRTGATCAFCGRRSADADRDRRIAAANSVRRRLGHGPKAKAINSAGRTFATARIRACLSAPAWPQGHVHRQRRQPPQQCGPRPPECAAAPDKDCPG